MKMSIPLILVIGAFNAISCCPQDYPDHGSNQGRGGGVSGLGPNLANRLQQRMGTYGGLGQFGKTDKGFNGGYIRTYQGGSRGGFPGSPLSRNSLTSRAVTGALASRGFGGRLLNFGLKNHVSSNILRQRSLAKNGLIHHADPEGVGSGWWEDPTSGMPGDPDPTMRLDDERGADQTPPNGPDVLREGTWEAGGPGDPDHGYSPFYSSENNNVQRSDDQSDTQQKNGGCAGVDGADSTPELLNARGQIDNSPFDSQSPNQEGSKAFSLDDLPPWIEKHNFPPSSDLKSQSGPQEYQGSNANANAHANAWSWSIVNAVPPAAPPTTPDHEPKSCDQEANEK